MVSPLQDKPRQAYTGLQLEQAARLRNQRHLSSGCRHHGNNWMSI